MQQIIVAGIPVKVQISSGIEVKAACGQFIAVQDAGQLNELKNLEEI